MWSLASPFQTTRVELSDGSLIAGGDKKVGFVGLRVHMLRILIIINLDC